MWPSLEPGEHVETRVRPARRVQITAYAPGTALFALGLFSAWSPDRTLAPLLDLGLTELGATLVLSSLLLAAATTLSWWLERRPLLTLTLGAGGLSAGANLFTGWALGTPLLILGAAWLTLLEAQRFTNGITLTTRRIVLPRLFRKPLGIAYTEMRAVHVSSAENGTIGSLILETSHGTLAAPDLPGADDLRERIEVRMSPVRVEPNATSLGESRARIERILSRRARRSEGDTA